MSGRWAHVSEYDEAELIDFVFAPAKPIDPEYRQLHSEAQLKWLEQWSPRPGAWIN